MKYHLKSTYGFCWESMGETDGMFYFDPGRWIFTEKKPKKEKEMMGIFSTETFHLIAHLQSSYFSHSKSFYIPDITQIFLPVIFIYIISWFDWHSEKFLNHLKPNFAFYGQYTSPLKKYFFLLKFKMD